MTPRGGGKLRGDPSFQSAGPMAGRSAGRLGHCGYCWQSFHPWASRIYWADRAITNTLAQTGTGKRFMSVTLYFFYKVYIYNFFLNVFSFCLRFRFILYKLYLMLHCCNSVFRRLWTLETLFWREREGQLYTCVWVNNIKLNLWQWDKQQFDLLIFLI